MSVLINLQDMFKTSALSTHTHTCFAAGQWKRR